MFLEVFSKERLVGETQLVSNLLDAFGGVFQQHASFQYDVLVYPFVGGALADHLDHLCEVFGRDAQLLGIPFHTSFRTEMFFQEPDELGKKDLCTGV